MKKLPLNLFNQPKPIYMIRNSTFKNWKRYRLIGQLFSGVAIAFFAAFPTDLIAQSSSPAPYCAVNHAYTGTDPCASALAKIARVEVSNLDHSASCPDGRGIYTYWDNVAAVDMSPGSDYEFTLTTGVTNNYYNEWGVWLDLNGDGDFTDAGEFLFRGVSTGAGATLIKSVSIPCSAIPGKTRMRIRNDYSYNGSPYTYGTGYDCGNSTYGNQGYGETWDFDVQILSVASPTSNFSQPDTVYTGWNATFANANVVGYTHKWYNSDLDATLKTVNATTTNYSYAFPTAGTYTLKLESSNCQGTAIGSKSVVVVDPTSTPIANFVSSKNQIYFSGNPEEVELYDLSSFGPTSWEWTLTPDVNSGAPWFWSSGNQYSQTPSAFFYDYGIYEVCLTVSNKLGSSAPLCRSAYIKVEEPTGSNYINVMGTDIKSTLDSGKIYDTGGPSSGYKDNEYYTFNIEPCGASSITLNFNSFDTEASWDFLKVYDGPDQSSPLLGSYSGTTLPPSLTAMSGRMTLLFTSDISGNAPGFEATWTSNIPQNGPISADFDLPDTLWECSGGTQLVLKNATTGVVAGQASYDWIIDFDPNVSYPPLYCDYCDEENPEWKVPASGQFEEYQIRMVASSCEGNDTVVKTLRVAPTTKLPTVDFSASNRRVSANSVVKLTEISTAACGYKWTITPVTGWTLEQGFSLTDANIDVKFTNAGSYHIELELTNDNGSSVKTKTNYIDVVDYCTPSVSIPAIGDVGINQVIIENIDNESVSGQAPGYTNYTSDFGVALTAGRTYTLEVSRLSMVNSMTRKAWIDFNRDGIFQESTERIMLETNANTASNTVTFTVPDYTYTVEGESRLRIGASLGASSFDACGPIQVGEFEDYGVMLMYDDLPPVITMNGMDTVYVEVNSSYTEDSAVCIDNIEGDITSRMIITNQIDLTQAGIYFVHYDVTDASGLAAVRASRMVIVSTDLTAPVLTLTGGTTYVHSVLTPFVEPGYSALDNPGNKNVTGDVIVTGIVDESTIADYNLIYSISDANGNSEIMIRTVQVRDIDAPVITSPAKVFWQVGTPFKNPVTVTDNFDQNVQLTKSGFIDVNVFGTYTVTFNAKDFSGNVSNAVTVEFEVGDATAPVIKTLQGSETIVVQVNDANFFEPPVTAVDDFFPNVSVTRDASALNIYELGSYPVIYTAEDGAGNTATFTRTIRVVDTEKPQISASPLNIQRWTGSFDPLEGVTAIDNYWSPAWFESNSAIEVIFSNVDVDYPGIYNIVYRATDGSGNISALKTRVVSVWTPTSLEGVDLASMVNVYPNPTSGKFTMKLDEQLGSEVDVRVMDALGNIVMVKDASAFFNGEAQFDLSQMSAGVYMIQIATEFGNTTKRVVVNK